MHISHLKKVTHDMKCPENCPPRKSFISLLSELRFFFLFVCDKFISKTNKNVITKFFYFNYIVRKLLHCTSVESTLLKSRTPYLINSLGMNPLRLNSANIVHPE